MQNRHHLKYTTPRRLALPTVLLAAALAGCGSDSSAGEEAVSTTVNVTAVDYAFQGVPTEVLVGSSLALENSSALEAHELVAIRLPDDEDRSVEELVGLPPDDLAGFFPGVDSVLIAGPGETGVLVEGDAVLDEPGRYAIICVIPTGADPVEYLTAAAESEGGPPQVDGGPPHIAGGMYTELLVVE